MHKTVLNDIALTSENLDAVIASMPESELKKLNRSAWARKRQSLVVANANSNFSRGVQSLYWHHVREFDFCERVCKSTYRRMVQP